MNCGTKKYFCIVLYFVFCFLGFFFVFSSAGPETLLRRAQKLGLQVGATTSRTPCYLSMGVLWVALN